MGVEHIWYLPLAVDTNRMDMVIANSPEIQKYKGDIAFVGSLYERNSYDKIKAGCQNIYGGILTQ